MQRLFEVSTLAMQCPNCHEAIEIDDLRGHDYFCRYCYENPYCLGHCDGEHRDDWATAGPDCTGQWTCDETSEVFVFTGYNHEWDNEHNWQLADEWTYTTEISGYWYDADEVYTCEGCETVMHSDDTCSNDNGDVYCQSCYEEDYERRQRDYDEDYEEDDDEDDRDYNRRNGGRHYSVPECAGCHNCATLTHYHLHTEETYCDACSVQAKRDYPGKVRPINDGLFTEEHEWAAYDREMAA